MKGDRGKKWAVNVGGASRLTKATGTFDKRQNTKGKKKGKKDENIEDTCKDQCVIFFVPCLPL